MPRVAEVTNVVNPIGDHSRSRRLTKIGAWIGVAVAIFALLDLLGVDIGAWSGGCGTRSKQSPRST
ncbi:MAG: hypothetical protein QOD48_441 [Gaiellaceae bacterium]|nr:hypothetical protein [Gaiellaceae bacterium]